MSETKSKHENHFNHTNGGRSSQRRTREERGLPGDDDLRALARLYLETQRRLWPVLNKTSPYAKAHDQDVHAMADAFKAQFLSGKPSGHHIPRPRSVTISVGVSYLRYSCDNSNPRSLDDQLRLQLEKAKARCEFIPWRYVFADASVTGTHSERAGYKLAKQALQSDGEVTTLYIDEIGRASRDGIEALKLGKLVQGLRKQLIGVSDGFDSQDQFSQTQLHMFAMFNEMFIEQLRHKVNRGMRGAVARGTSIGKPALGYKLKAMLDSGGQPFCGKDGAPLKTYAIDPDTQPYVEMAFKLYGEDHWSGTKIAKHFNRLKVNGKRSWNSSAIYQLLRRHLYAGIRVYNKTSMRNNAETGKIMVTKQDRSEWLVNRQRHLQIIPRKLWKRVQERLAEASAASPSLGKKHGVNKRLFAKTLFDGTLVCGCCGRELNLRRSAGQHKQVACPNSSEARYGCTFRGSKSIRIIDQALLGYLRNHLLNTDHIKVLVERANHYLAEEAGKPLTDTTGLDQTLDDLTVKRDRLTQAIENDGGGEVAVIVERLKQVEAEIKEAKSRLQDIQKANAVPPKPLNVDDVVGMLDNIDVILKQEPAAAAPVLRELTGKISVHQKQVPGRKKPVWVAKFGPNLVPLLSRTARENNYPATSTWEYLNQRGWTMAQNAEVELDEDLKYMRYAPQVLELVDGKGMSCSQAALVLGINEALTRQALKFARHGLKTTQADPNQRSLADAFMRTQGPEVARRRDELDQPFHVIAEAMGVTRETARKAYLRHHRKVAEQTGDTERLKDLGCNRNMSLTKLWRVRELLKAGHSVNEIVAEVGCSKTMVYREKRKL